MKPMLRYELCKLFARPSGKAALLLLAVLVAVSTFSPAMSATPTRKDRPSTACPPAPAPADQKAGRSFG
ncbi:MAG: hypothetical protein ACLS82_12275 [Evtepia gabavorous]